ncbi:MAG: hypothetical protein O8C67_05015 [Candidatus Methanoperedens sp.]|nr:hypothetical protein [Candidatus Methanoperedens sp.]
MVTNLNFKPIIDLPKWRPLASSPVLFVANTTLSTGYAITSDLRNNEDSHPFIFGIFPQAAAIDTGLVYGYNTYTDEWQQIGIMGGFSSIIHTYAAAAVMPSQGPKGTLAGGATTTTVTLSTVLPRQVGFNSIANRGDGRGYKVRIIGNAVGSSGKTEERIVIANTGNTTTPTLTLDSPLSFIPTAGDRYEFLSGKIIITDNSQNVNVWDIMCNTSKFGGVQGSTTFPVIIPLDELYVPYDRVPGEGFLGILTATGSGAATLTGQSILGDASVLANEYRNFQIRIVTDVGTPTAAGQRRNITSHTAGPSPVYTVPAWAVTPSVNAVYVIENNSDRVLFFNPNSNSVWNYTISTDTLSTAVWASRAVALGGSGIVGCQSFGIEPDIAKNARHSYIYLTSGNSANSGQQSFDMFDIAGSATGAWTTFGAFENSYYGPSFVTGTNIAYDPITNQGRFFYINFNGTQRMFRFDMKYRMLEPFTYLKIAPSMAVTVGQPMAVNSFIDGNTKLSFLYWVHPNTNAFSVPIIG